MFTAKDYAMPQSLEEAYEALTARKTNHIVAGCAWLRMGSKRINTAVDLSDVGLDYIRDTGEAIEIGAMTTYRSVETSSLLQEIQQKQPYNQKRWEYKCNRCNRKQH